MTNEPRFKSSIPPLCGRCGGRTDGKVSAPTMYGFGALISCECPPVNPAVALVIEAMEAPTNVLPIRPSKTGESDAAKWARVKLAKRRVFLAMDAEPAMARIHIREALIHLRGLGEE